MAKPVTSEPSQLEDYFGPSLAFVDMPLPRQDAPATPKMNSQPKKHNNVSNNNTQRNSQRLEAPKNSSVTPRQSQVVRTVSPIHSPNISDEAEPVHSIKITVTTNNSTDAVSTPAFQSVKCPSCGHLLSSRSRTKDVDALVSQHLEHSCPNSKRTQSQQKVSFSVKLPKSSQKQKQKSKSKNKLR